MRKIYQKYNILEQNNSNMLCDLCVWWNRTSRPKVVSTQKIESSVYADHHFCWKQRTHSTQRARKVYREIGESSVQLHKKLTEEEGFDPSSDEYYVEIDKRIRLEFPHKFGTTGSTETAKPVQQVASARRTTKSSRRTVRLTPSQVAIAKKLGVPLEEYAKQLNITKEV